MTYSDAELGRLLVDTESDLVERKETFNFGTPGLTDYRNPNLAEAMRVLGYVQRFGAGIVAARNALRRNGNPPAEFDVRQSHVLVVVRPAP